VALADCLPAEGGPAAGGRRRLAACPHCRRAGRVEPIGPPGQRLGAVPVLAAYRCLGPCGPAADQRRHDDPDPRKRRFFQKYDLGKIREIEALPIPYWRPTAEFPKTFARWQSDLRPAGIERVDQLYTKRNLWALAALRARALRSACPDQALFALTAICLAASKMQRYSPRSGFPNMLLTGTYYVPPVGREIEVGSWYAGKVRALLRGYTAIRQHLPTPAARLIAAGDARKLAIPANSVDYIFTDPPYADAVQYGELNFVWESWLGAESQWHADEIVVNAARGKTEEEWARGLGQAMRECCRVLKPGRWLSLCYHDTSERRWATIQDLMAAAGLVVDTADSPPSIDTGQKSFNQFMTDKATKRDLVVNFRKPRPGTRRPTTKDGRRTTDDGRRATGPRRVGRAQRAPPKRRATEDGAKRPRPSPVVRRPSATAGEGLPAFERSARRIIREYLRAHPGATQDRIYDELIRRMIRRGRLQPHDFQALLRSVAREARPQRSGGAGRKTGAQAAARWYLKPRRG
jgi:hypothetical protein